MVRLHAGKQTGSCAERGTEGPRIVSCHSNARSRFVKLSAHCMPAVSLFFFFFLSFCYNPQL